MINWTFRTILMKKMLKYFWGNFNLLNVLKMLFRYLPIFFFHLFFFLILTFFELFRIQQTWPNICKTFLEYQRFAPYFFNPNLTYFFNCISEISSFASNIQNMVEKFWKYFWGNFNLRNVLKMVFRDLPIFFSNLFFLNFFSYFRNIQNIVEKFRNIFCENQRFAP